MTLTQKLEELVNDDFEISFKRDILSLVITLEKESPEYGCEISHLPLSDHFYESKLVDCLDFMRKKW